MTTQTVIITGGATGLGYAIAEAFLRNQANVILNGRTLAHSAIHCTYNQVMHRFTVYAASSLLLFMLWFMLGVRILFA
jgi:NAD(P)-dependent dehydrogenase (short-subunit alcohol dehydrogenase family)